MKEINRTENTGVNILYVGRLINLHRIDMVLRVLKDVVINYPRVKLLIVGDGPERDKLEKLTLKLNLSGYVSFLGYLNRDQLREVDRKSDILINNRIYDVFPNVIVEAMSYGVTVITSSRGGPEEIVKDGKTGIFVESGTSEELKSKLINLINNKEFRVKLAQNARENLNSNFTWEINLEKLEKEFSDLL